MTLSALPDSPPASCRRDAASSCGQTPITVLGMGAAPPLSPEELPMPMQRLLAEADVLAGGERMLDAIPQGAEERVRLAAPLEKALRTIRDRHAAGRRVLVLADGDPLYFGIGATLVRTLGAACVRILPQVSSLQAACARLGLPWHDVRSCSLHGRHGWQSLHTALRAGTPVCVLTDARYSPGVIARHLLDRGADWLRMAIFERMGAADEAGAVLSLDEAAVRPESGTCATVLLLPHGRPRIPFPGMDHSRFARHAGLVTKRPVRAAALSLLRVEPHHVVWDIGSGSGAVALEAAALAWAGQVCAVERHAMRAIDIQHNRRLTGALNVDIRYGSAPDCLPGLPAPDRIFLGGGLGGRQGAQAEALLKALCAYLPAGGRLVAACVLLGSLHAALEFFHTLGWPLELECVQAAEARPLAGDIHLAAHNPAYLLAVEKPA